MADLQITRERTSLFQITVTQLVNGVSTPVDLAGKVLTFEAKRHYGDTSPVIEKESPSDGITIGSPTSDGKAVLQIDPDDTEALSAIPESEKLVYDLSMQDGPTNDYQLASGKLKVLANVAP